MDLTPTASIGYIIDTYNKYEKNKDVKEIFQLHNIWYCIREVEVSEDGKPIIESTRIGKNNDDDENIYYIYDAFEDARNFMIYMKQVESRGFN